MKQRQENKFHLPVKTIMVFAAILSIIVISAFAFKDNNDIAINKATFRDPEIEKDSVESVHAFMQVYTVLMHPRCMNCHPAGNRPLQGDDSHIHIMNVQRGKDGKGLYALKCSNCHQPTNVAGLHTPPGNPKWQLPPADMKMVFQGKSAHDLALQIMDYNKNGHKNKEQLLEHARDTLVKAGWSMGEGRPAPPLAYNDFVKAWDTWIEKGAYAPNAK